MRLQASSVKRYLIHVVIGIITAGLYLPVWLARWDGKVRERVPEVDRVPSAWALGGSAVLGVVSIAVFGQRSPGVAFGVSLAAVGAFLVGLYQSAATLERALDALDRPGLVPAWIVTGAVALAVAAVEVGNRVPSWWVRGPVLVAILGLPGVFWLLHRGFEEVRSVTEEPSSEADVQEPASGDP